MLLEEPGKGKLDLGRAEQAQLSRDLRGKHRKNLPVHRVVSCEPTGDRHSTAA